MKGLDPDLLSLQEVRDCMRRAKVAQKSVAQATQGQVDAYCKAVSQAAAKAAADLARLAVEETGIGRAHDKVLKNLFASEGVWESIAAERTVGVIRRDEQRGVIEVATPIGVVCGIVPTTNPTSTAIGKALIALKGRNAIVFSPHPRAVRCIAETVEVMRRALERAGLSADLVQVLRRPTLDSTQALMSHDDMKLILATGGAGLVRAAYSSGKPAYGVGPGNVPAYVDRSADLDKAARWIVASQSFDNATLCCSEQALVLDAPIAKRMLEALVARGAHLCNDDETRLLEVYCNRGGHMNPDVVGKDPVWIARAAGFDVAPSTSVLLARQDAVGPEFPLSIEVLCPLLSVHVVDGWEQGCETSFAILKNGGLGHTIGVWATDERVLEAWFVEKPASRIVANGPTSQGAVGYSTGLAPSMSLGCGPLAGNITSDNISARHLVNVKRVGLFERNFEEQYARDVARAAAMLGQPSEGAAPRGTGLPGDPALDGGRAARRPLVDPKSWNSTPTSFAPAASPRPGTTTSNGSSAMQAPPSQPALGAPRPESRAPRPDLRAPRPDLRAPRPDLRAPRPASSAPRPGGSVTALGSAPSKSTSAAAGPLASGDPSAAFLRANAGTSALIGDAFNPGVGCPMGPCRGCPHHDVANGACTA